VVPLPPHVRGPPPDGARRVNPTLIPTLHRVAGQWHEHHGDIVEAIRHAQAAGDWASRGAPARRQPPHADPRRPHGGSPRPAGRLPAPGVDHRRGARPRVRDGRCRRRPLRRERGAHRRCRAPCLARCPTIGAARSSSGWPGPGSGWLDSVAISRARRRPSARPRRR
jgi:hypothetical protein